MKQNKSVDSLIICMDEYAIKSMVTTNNIDP